MTNEEVLINTMRKLMNRYLLWHTLSSTSDVWFCQINKKQYLFTWDDFRVLNRN